MKSLYCIKISFISFAFLTLTTFSGYAKSLFENVPPQEELRMTCDIYGTVVPVWKIGSEIYWGNETMVFQILEEDKITQRYIAEDPFDNIYGLFDFSKKRYYREYDKYDFNNCY
jgi:hypothetical protein